MNWPEHLITSHTGDCLRECAETIQVMDYLLLSEEGGHDHVIATTN